ncbi:hypothetical protein VTJ49DRAFT_3599 [Mycothermus thermophilus]|uniref:Uncharacterized protein n=1 Tax=Humicola insolens TaxID=85995 RepID=A0ABR3VP65_HUMIN
MEAEDNIQSLAKDFINIVELRVYKRMTRENIKAMLVCGMSEDEVIEFVKAVVQAEKPKPLRPRIVPVETPGLTSNGRGGNVLIPDGQLTWRDLKRLRGEEEEEEEEESMG